jgi:hypothetical protein
MLPRVLRRYNYVKNNTPFFRKSETPDFGIEEKVGGKPTPYFGKVGGGGGDTDWKIRTMVKSEIDKEFGKELSEITFFSGLVGILFFIAFLYERQIK